MTVRELIRYARAHGFVPIMRKFTGGALWWTDGNWRIQVTPNTLPARRRGALQRYTQIEVFERDEDWSFRWERTMYVLTATTAFDELVLAGVLPVLEGAPAVSARVKLNHYQVAQVAAFLKALNAATRETDVEICVYQPTELSIGGHVLEFNRDRETGEYVIDQIVGG